MRRLLPLIVLAAACAAPAPRYTADDPLSGKVLPKPIQRNGKTIYTGLIPTGYTRTQGRLSLPLVEILRRNVYWGETSISIEYYNETDGAPAFDSFARSLHPKKPEPTQREIGGKTLSAYHDLRFSSYARRISVQDAYADVLGTHHRPPRLDPIGKRRFPKGGDAYRLHRCKKVGAWRILGEQSRLRIGLKKGDAEPKRMTRRERRIFATCFGRVSLVRLLAGEAVGSIPKPSLSRLRLMAKDEWDYGARRRIDRECVHLRRLKDGYAAIRFRAPDHAFDGQHAAWELFLGSLTLPGEI